MASTFHCEGAVEEFGDEERRGNFDCGLGLYAAGWLGLGLSG